MAVIGHVEWTTLALVDSVPLSGDVTHTQGVWEGPAGGGAVAAVQLAKLAGECTFFTALGDDAAGRQSRTDLAHLGVKVLAPARSLPTRTALSLVDAAGERTTMTLGPRLQPEISDGWGHTDFSTFDAIFFVSGAPEVLTLARSTPILVMTTREMTTAAQAKVSLDAMVGSGRDPAEQFRPDLLSVPPRWVITTDGANGGLVFADGTSTAYRAVPVPGPIVDTYGVGDTFAATLTFGLGSGHDLITALNLAAQCAAASLTGRGPFTAQSSFAHSGVPGTTT